MNNTIKKYIDSNYNIDITKAMKYFNDYNKDNYIIKPFNEKFNITNQEKHYHNEMIKYYTNLNSLIKDAKQNDIIFHSKMFLFPQGGDNSEIFSFSHLIWSGCTNNNKINCFNVFFIVYTRLI